MCYWSEYGGGPSGWNAGVDVPTFSLPWTTIGTNCSPRADEDLIILVSPFRFPSLASQRLTIPTLLNLLPTPTLPDLPAFALAPQDHFDEQKDMLKLRAKLPHRNPESVRVRALTLLNRARKEAGK